MQDTKMRVNHSLTMWVADEKQRPLEWMKPADLDREGDVGGDYTYRGEDIRLRPQMTLSITTRENEIN